MTNSIIGDKGEKPAASKNQNRLAGYPLNRGIAMGKPVYMGLNQNEIYLRKSPINSEDRQEVPDFEMVIEQTKTELRDLQVLVKERISEVSSKIFTSHLIMLEDEAFSGMMREKIAQGTNPGDAITEVVNYYISLLKKNKHSLIREKIHDVKDLGHRLLRNLESGTVDRGDYSGQVVVSRNITPSDLVKLTIQNAEGFVLCGVSAASHIAIIARSLNVPVLLLSFDCYPALLDLENILLDGYEGFVITDPGKEDIDHYLYITREEEKYTALPVNGAVSTYTRDGVRIKIHANINLLSDVPVANRFRAEGVGLYRSEIPFLIRNVFISEEEQYGIISNLYSLFGEEYEIVLRTLDIGGDKSIPQMQSADMNNRMVSLRGIRFSLRNREIFAVQIRAMLRASYGKRLNILFPLISSIEEFQQAKDFVYSCIADMKSEGLNPNPAPRFGAMVELPSAVVIIDDLIRAVDFISIGTNDLTQYLLGIDRIDELTAPFMSLFHPAVVRTLEKIIRTCEKAECDVSVCGDAAMDAHMLPFMIGAGLRKISIDPKRIPEVRKVIGAMSLEDAEMKTRLAVTAATTGEIQSILF